MAAIATLQDDFEFGGIDSGKWTATNGQVVVGTNLDLEISSILGGNYVSLNSITTYSLIASNTFIQLTDAGNQTITSFEVYPIYLVADANNKILLRITGNVVQAIQVVANVTSNIGSSVAYNSTTMKWFRVREAGGTTFFEYAADPTGSWTQITSVANPITLTALTVEVLVGTWQAESSTSTAKFDNINLTPNQQQFSWKGYTWNKRVHAGPPANNQTWGWGTANISGPDGSDFMTVSLTNPSGTSPVGCEFFSAKRGFGYGTYTMVVATRLDNIHAASCFGGMFTFDVNEIRDYGQGTLKNILHSHVYDNGGATFITDAGTYTSDVVQTHRLIWAPGGLTFDAFIGSTATVAPYFHSVQTTNLPTPGLERVHFNTFVDVNIAGFGTVPTLNVVLRDFSFTNNGAFRRRGFGR
jgi:hypothetical protein